MDNGATERETLEEKLEKKLQDPNAAPMYLPLEFLKVITSDFSTERELGRGAYGVVYKGVLQSGKVIAVKKIFDAHLLDSNNKFENEITCLMGVRHQNVVQLVGYCVQTRKEVIMLPSGEHVMVEIPVCLLCFEFHCKGSLDKYVSDFLALGWDMRYEIIRGVCRGLHYLHDKFHIVHLDLKPQNVLMDAMMIPKIADFGLSRLLGEQKSKTVTTNFAGTLGYMAQEYIDHGIISPKADIFSLGVIIIEIITGDRVYPNISGGTETSSVKHFTEEVVGSWRKRLELIPMHMSSEMHIQQVEQCISIALKCLKPDSNERPTSLYIVQSLNAEETKSRSLENSTSVAEKDTGNQNLQSHVNVNTQTMSAINSLNECANLFQWVTSAILSPKLQMNEIKKEKLHGDVRHLQRDLQCLSDTLPAMYNLIDRAEWRIHDHYVAELLARLKDAVYDAEDILDEFRWYETKLSVEGNAISVETIIEFFHSVTHGCSNSAADIQKRLNDLSRELERMGLVQAVPRFDKAFRPETTSFPTEAKIFGRDEDKKKLIGLLLDTKENDGVPKNNNAGPSGQKRKRSGVCSSVTSIPVLPIVGIGGVGKTTLAQNICNHSKVKHHFHLIIWICVSDDFDVKRLTKEAIEQSTSPEKVPKTDNLSLLQSTLANSLNNKRFLLVLDDMWGEKKEDWKRFCAPFRNVLPGSMMLVTTRSPKVADVVRTMDPFPLGGLNKGDFWMFFKLCVFGSDNFKNYPELEQIGKKILPKLKGSPLAAKTVGRMLGMSLDLAHWDMILMSELWELGQEETDILPALRLSYMYLPFHLKRCFSFCAVYPKDYNFRKKDLAEIWEAEGLVEHQYSGEQYFEELAYLSFFQKTPRSKEKYVIHDLMHDMAQLVSRDECFIVKEKKDLPKIPLDVRHLLVLKGGDVECLDLFKYDMARHRKLRTLLCGLSLNSKTGHDVMEKWCTKLFCMRVMVCSSISKWGLPGSISNMKHLRYIKILNSCLCKKLPATFCRLYNMQIFYAENWKIRDIPSGFGMLINLQKFESVNCQFHNIHSVGIPKGATNEGQREQLKITYYNGESLPSWFHAPNSEQNHHYDSNNSTLLSLTNVEIADCENISDLEQFLQPAYLPNIKKIEVSNCRSLESVPTERFGDLRLLEEMHVSHCPNIKSLHLFAPSLKKLYLKDSGNLTCKIECSSLTVLHLSECPLESIELQMSNLPLLQELEISSCPSLTVIRDSEPICYDILHGEDRSRDIGRLNITISNCRSLELVPTDRFGYFCVLEVLSVSHCPKIKSRHLFAPSLKKLYLEDSGNLGGNIECSSLTALCLSNCPLESIELQARNLPLLQDLNITSCSSLTIIRDSGPISTNLFQDKAQSTMGKFPLGTHLNISFCMELKNIDGLLYLPAIESIRISACGLLSLPANRLGVLPCLKHLEISMCPRLDWQSGMLLPSSLQKLGLSSCGNFSAWFPSCLENLTSLESLDICDCECIVSVPDHLWSNSLKSVQRLKFHSCPKLKSVGGPDTVAHIKNLYIADCPELKEFDQPLERFSLLGRVFEKVGSNTSAMVDMEDG